MKIGIVLSGGGIRGIAHLGVFKALKEHQIPISAISGTSAGAIAGALFANGVEPDTALKIFQETRLLRFLRPVFKAPALLNLETAYPLFKKYLPHDSFEKLNIPLSVSTTNFNEGKLVYFNKGNLIQKVLASCCIPGIFSPILIDDKFYIDGGVLDNFPIEPLLNQCDFIIGSSCNNLPVINKFRNIKHVLERAAVLSINHETEQKLPKVNVLIDPKGLGETSIFDLKKAEEIFLMGYQEALIKIPFIKKAIAKNKN